MKKITLQIVLMLYAAGMMAQKPVNVIADSLSLSKEYVSCLSVIIPEAAYEEVLDSWIKTLQSNTKSKAVNKGGEVSIFGARSKDLRTEPFNVYSRLENRDSAVYLAVAFELDRNVFVDKLNTTDEFTKARNFLKEFAVARYTEEVKNQLDAEDRILRDLEKEASRLENEHARLLRSVESNKESIVKEKSNITQQKTELNTVSTNLDEQKSLLSGMEEGSAKKEKSEIVKELEKRRKKAENSIENSEKKIARSEKEIEESSAAIPGNEMAQDEIRQKIAAQEPVYQLFVEKYKKVKAY
ncbi:MAG: hypothetical protein MUD02_02815 [Bacteroidales bacterium]|nr:hypothetical protein [Bacteroidales bacterium]